MTPHLEEWVRAIGHEVGANGAPSPESIARTVRAAVVSAGFLTLSRLTAGLREAYRPLGISDAVLVDPTEEALKLLVLTGELDPFTTASGRAYAVTQPRVIDWGGADVAVLGASPSSLDRTGVRRLPRGSAMTLLAPIVTLAHELGRAEWIPMLVSMGGADPGDGDVRALAHFVKGLASNGQRYDPNGFDQAAVLSGRGDFFGEPRRAPDGRWARPGHAGTFPAFLQGGYRSRRVVMHLGDDGFRLWEPPEHDLWRWIVISMTLAQGDDVVRYVTPDARLLFLTPPPRQLERAARLAGEQVGPWSWRIDAGAATIIQALIMGPNVSMARRSPA